MINEIFKNNQLEKRYTITFIKLGISGTGVYDTSDTILKTECFGSAPEAKERISNLIKEKEYVRHQGHIINLKEQIELHTNF